MNPNMESDAYKAFRSRWEQREREAAEVYKHERMAHVIGLLLQDFDAVRLDEVSGEVGVMEAVGVSGYSESSIWRFLDADVPNVGEPGLPSMRILDLPFKPRRPDVTSPQNGQSMPDTRSSAPALGTAQLETIDD